jgi:hypothetical protein
MYRSKLRTVGISFLGGNSGFEGNYELWIDNIRAVNDQDVTRSGESSVNVSNSTDLPMLTLSE